ncbi:hypothetical protein MGLY_07630 [Neomoorella glycerini]|uniref:DUF5320 domain-containing protein n=1 Tax=Neomoorella glycerini TaxID=55779 RepID=A0A6I5ZNE0_9FIRM|nr:DUF5320 domain-containing protein [Moorella glycerini]QGP91430.1 hypothetical protein MGLY_07630 [Moorella glycerini]
MCNYAGYGHNRGHDWGPQRGCCCHGHHPMGFHRHFLTAAEKKARLEEYLKELQAEVKAVEERLKKLGEGA